MKEGSPRKWDYETDVIVIGAGAAGPAVAISAHAAGSKVLILERMSGPSGDMALSAGIVYAAGTSIQKKLGIEDTADRMYKLYIASVPNSNTKERERLREICKSSSEVIEMCFVIFDEKTRKSCGNNLLMPPLSPDLSREIELGLAKTAWTIGELGKKIGVDGPSTLETTLANYNEDAKSGKDPEFGSTHFLEPLNHPPFYAIKCEPTISAPTGGLDANQEAQVLNVFGRIIPRLYAVGTVASLCPGYPGGGANMVSIFHLGRKAGRNAAREPLRG